MDPQMLIQQLTSMDEDTIIKVMDKILAQKPELAPSVVAFAVPDLTYAPCRALGERRSKGVVKSYDSSKGFGFIECRELKMVFGNDVYVHEKQIGRLSAPGTEVSFAVLLNEENKPQAFDIQPATGVSVKRTASGASKSSPPDMRGLPMPGFPGGLPMPGFPNGLPMPGMPGGLPMPGMPAGMPGMPAGMPMPGMPGGLPMPGMPGGLPMPGMPGGLPMPGMPGGLPMPGMPGGLPMPGMPAGLPMPGMPGGLPGAAGAMDPEMMSMMSMMMANGGAAQLNEV